MELNRETAMRLWNKTFGKETSAHDLLVEKLSKVLTMTVIANLHGMWTIFIHKVKVERQMTLTLLFVMF